MTATEADLLSLGLRRCWVRPVKLNIRHPDPGGLGPFCDLRAQDSAPERPGVYAWWVDGNVMYVGESRELRQITQGRSMRRAYNDYTYMPPSKALQVSSPRVWVNGLLNRALVDKRDVSWWWLETGSELDATRLEAELIRKWSPPWNRAFPWAAPAA